MSRQLPIRLSKLKAVKSIAAMTSPPPPSPSKSTENPKLILKFPGDLWDACDPRAHEKNPSDASQTAQSATQTSNNQAQASVDPPRRPARPPRPCNIKIAGFQYGGPDRKSKKGSQWENKVTLEQPCLKPGCTSCMAWHPHLMHESREGLQRQKSEVEKAHTSFLEAQVSDSVAEDVFLSNGVKRCDSVMGSPECQDLPPQLRRPARFKLRSVKGRTKFAALTRAIEERRHHIAGQKHPTSASFGGRPRRRYRIKLAFESRRGREEYARLVERYL